MVIVPVVVIRIAKEVAVAVPDLDATAADILGLGLFVFLLQNGSGHPVVDDFQLVCPARGLDFDLADSGLDLDELIPQILEIRDDRVGKGIGLGHSGPDGKRDGKFQ